jgi:dihydropteroate synthase
MPAVMGIVNVTPDSFSDGGRYLDQQKAVEHALTLAEQGADILDIGGESTRPYSLAVPLEEELSRVIPVVAEVAKRVAIPISVDTSKGPVARAAIDAGAEIINDVTALHGDPEMLSIVEGAKVGVCAMHMQGNPQTMQDNPSYGNVTAEIHEYLKLQRNWFIAKGIQRERICLDPGIGFGKSGHHNLRLISEASRFLDLGCPVLIGHSRKGFIARLMSPNMPNCDPGDDLLQRDLGTLTISVCLAQQGIQVLRVHNVAATVAALRILAEISPIARP